jgi:hypothetical protein
MVWMDIATVETDGGETGARRRMPRLRLLVGLALLGVGVYVASTTSGGAAGATLVYAFLNFFAGVVTLVALSLTVMGGLVATDRFYLRIGHRVFLQGVHRATAIIAIVFLGLHISLKILSGSATPLDPFVPFANLAKPIYVGLGTIASYLMIMVFWTGVIRGRFAGSGRPWMWRTLHAAAYLAWPIAITHGLTAGRPAKTWVNLSYMGCVVFVLIGLLVRLYVTLGRRTHGPTTGSTAIGINVQTAVIPRVGESGFRPGGPDRSVESTGPYRWAEKENHRGRLRLVTDEPVGPPSRWSDSPRHQRDEEPAPPRRSRRSGESGSGEPSYRRPSRYVPAADSQPSRRGRRTASGEELDDGAY